MKTTVKILFWICILAIGITWHPFKKNNDFAIYNLSDFQLDKHSHHYLLLKNVKRDTIYKDEYIKGPFKSIMKAHNSNQTEHYGELHYLPIVRKNHGN